MCINRINVAGAHITRIGSNVYKSVLRLYMQFSVVMEEFKGGRLN